MDMSFMGKFLVQGRDAGRCLNRISGNNVDGATGVITYTQWLNEQGLLEADLTVTKLSAEEYLVVVTDTMVRHAGTWMKRHMPEDAHACVTDVTSAYGQLNVQGPRSRELLQSLTTTDLSNEGFPFRSAHEIDIGLARDLGFGAYGRNVGGGLGVRLRPAGAAGSEGPLSERAGGVGQSTLPHPSLVSCGDLQDAPSRRNFVEGAVRTGPPPDPEEMSGAD